MTPEIVETDPFVQEVFEALDNLRDSGIMNMFGAAPVLERMYGFDHNTATKFLSLWMNTYSKRHPNG